MLCFSKIEGSIIPFMYKSMFLYEKTHRYLKNDYQFFDTLKIKDRKIRRNCTLFIKVKFPELERSSPIKSHEICFTIVLASFILVIILNVLTFTSFVLLRVYFCR